MMPSAGPRLATASLLLALQTLILILELLVFNHTINTHKGYTSLRQWFGPIGLALLGIVLVPTVFAYPKAVPETAATQCPLVVDADIAGQGVRIAAFVQVCILILVSLFGSFHPRATGVKEVGAGLVLTSASLAVAVIVRMARGSLTSVDAAISAMILDGQNMALAIQLTAKETLASRWQVKIVVAAQALGLGTVITLMARFKERKFLADDCGCLTVFWWGWLGSCLPSASELEPKIFWTYFACRFVGICQASFHALWNMNPFDDAEKETRMPDDKKSPLTPLIDITFLHFNAIGAASYSEMPASVTYMYLFYGVLALTSLVIAETTIKDLNIIPSSTIDSTGQIIALFIAGATFLRAVWLFGHLFANEENWREGFKWPFHFHEYSLSSALPYFTTALLRLPPRALELGSMLKDPLNPQDKYEGHVPAGGPRAHFHHAADWKERTYDYFTSGRARSSTFFSLFGKSNMVEARHMETRWFTPTEIYLEHCAALPEIQRSFDDGQKSVEVFLVVGVQYAEGLRIGDEDIRRPGTPKSAQLGASPSLGLVEVEGSVGTRPDWRAGRDQTDARPYHDDVLYSYGVQKCVLTRAGAARVLPYVRQAA